MEAGDVGDGGLGRLRQQHADPVAAGEAVRGEHVGEAVRQPAQVVEAVTLHGAVMVEMDQRERVAGACRSQTSVPML